MAKTLMRCPFNEKICEECQLYRGRHYYMSNCEHYRGYIKTKNAGEPDGHPRFYDLEEMKKLLEPWSDGPKKVTSEPGVTIKIIDMESGEERYTDVAETKTWKWDDASTIRVVNGYHVTSPQKLQDIMRYQEARGTKEIIIYEAPRFMLLGGG